MFYEPECQSVSSKRMGIYEEKQSATLRCVEMFTNPSTQGSVSH